MSIQQNFPGFIPSLNLNFARSKRLDPRVTFSRATKATVINELGLVEVVSNNVPRFDHVYDSSTGAIRSLGLLIEEERTNLLLYTDFSNSNWGGYCGNKNSISYNTTDVLAPDGKNTATKIVTGPTLGCTGSIPARGLIFNQNLDITTLVDTYTVSLYVRGAVGGEVLFFGLTDSYQANYTLTTSWQRITFTGINNRTDYQLGRIFQFGTNNLNATYYVWGPQAELGSFPTSYIPTTGLPTTRLADRATIDGENFLSFYNQLEGTYFMSTKIAHTPSPNVSLLFRTAATGGPRVSLEHTTTNTLVGIVENSGIYYFSTSGSGLVAANQFRKTSLSYSSSNGTTTVGAASNLTTLADTASSVDVNKSMNTLYLGRYSDNAYYLNGHIQQFVYYPRKLTNAQLQQLTK